MCLYENGSRPSAETKLVTSDIKNVSILLLLQQRRVSFAEAAEVRHIASRNKPRPDSPRPVNRCLDLPKPSPLAAVNQSPMDKEVNVGSSLLSAPNVVHLLQGVMAIDVSP